MRLALPQPVLVPRSAPVASGLDQRVLALVVGLAVAAAAGLIATSHEIVTTLSHEPLRVATLLALTLALQLFSVQVYGRGSVSVSAIGILATAFVFDTGTTMAVAVAAGIARRLGYRDDELEAIEIGALLHDIGKIGVPLQVLRKNGPLTDDEWELVKKHPLISDYILSELDLHPFVRQCARSSHERIDGMGYPDGLRGDEIPLPARIVFVADALDALTSVRPYRPSRPMLAALAEIREHAGTQFCPRVVKALEELWRREPRLFMPLPSPGAATDAA